MSHSSTSTKTAWKSLRLNNGKILSNYHKSKWIVGEWRIVPAPTEKCKGLNCSLLIQDAISYVLGEKLAHVEYDGIVIESEGKLTCEKMRILKTWSWTKEMSVKMAVFSAEQVLPNFEKMYPDDDRPRKAIDAAKTWLVKLSEEAAYAAENVGKRQTIHNYCITLLD